MVAERSLRRATSLDYAFVSFNKIDFVNKWRHSWRIVQLQKSTHQFINSNRFYLNNAWNCISSLPCPSILNSNLSINFLPQINRFKSNHIFFKSVRSHSRNHQYVFFTEFNSTIYLSIITTFVLTYVGLFHVCLLLLYRLLEVRISILIVVKYNATGTGWLKLRLVGLINVWNKEEIQWLALELSQTPVHANSIVGYLCDVDSRYKNKFCRDLKIFARNLESFNGNEQDRTLPISINIIQHQYC